ncbi:uncharacterized protein LOC118490461 [Helianthus annuus]|uniref:uncharacterized protein LOC118490461 n=1 Tax=Helianthus annuus TaxID=4232 RepID=UPI001652E5C8|nr:uncharacterized protein LOC118490461 [Helianthus annuus]
MTIEPRMEDLHLTTDALIISAAVGDYHMRRILVDTGSSEDIIYEHCFNRMQPEDRKLLELVHAPIKGFTGEKVGPIGQITFPVTFGQSPRERTILLTFPVVRAESYHNMIIGRFTLGKLDAIVSTARGFMKFPTPRGIATVFRDKIGEVLSTKRYRQGPTGATGPERWILSTRHPDQTVTIGDTLYPEIRSDLKQLLRRNVDIFAFEHSDMTGVPRDKAEHKLATLPGVKPVAQGKRSMAPDRRAAVVKEVRKLVEAGILRETQYHTWVSNPVMVKKPDGTWRMCIDFKDLNKACPKDAYPLPEIDLKVNSLVPYRFKCFLDAYKGYHQIKMSKEDEEKTVFNTDVGIFCYTKMPFGLRNAGATYQRLMDKVFETQIGRNLEVYVDYLVIKSREEKQMLADIEETFQRLREYNIKLNPKKCSFGVEEGKFLGVVVTRDGFKANPEKVAAIARMPSPRTLKEAQALNGRLVAINRFLARHAEKSLPFIKTLKDCLNKKNFKWTNEAEEALQDMKRFIEGLPMLTAPRPNEVLKMYLAAAHTAPSISGTRNTVSHVGKAGLGTGTRHTATEKIFAGTPSTGPNQLPTATSPAQAGDFGRLAKWAIELGALDIEYQKRTAVKGQVIADFLAEIPEGEAIVDPVVQDIPESSTARQTWKLYTDGSSSGKGSGAGLMLISPDEIRLMYALRFDFECSNNEAEYEALLGGLRMAKSMGAARVDAYVDSLLVNNQVIETHEAKDESMAKYLAKTKELMDSFDNVTLNHVHRGKNQIADALSKLATSGMEKEVKVETLQTPSLEPAECFRRYSGRSLLFTDRIFQEWCANLHIQQIFTPVAHPQGNGQVEWTNRSLLDGIKKRLGHEGSSWVEELPNVLWAHRTMPKTSNNETPFSLTYGAEAMIPAEAGLPSLRRLNIGDDNDRSLREGLDLLEERREAAAISEAKYKKALEKYYNQRVAKQNFKTGDYVMRDNEASRMEPSGKLGPNWEGPYVIQEDLGKGAYRLSQLDGTPVPRSWNIAQLRKCYL